MKCDTPIYVMPKAGYERVPVPCGKCPPCKMRRVNSWVFRLLEEEKVSSSSHFVTLTYDTRFVPISDNGFMTLVKKDFQLYMKRLRKLCVGRELKYYAVGEYGSKNKRPHYHAIIFNCPNFEFFADAWSLDGVPIGGVHVGSVSGDSIAYTMKYIDKQGDFRAHSRDDRLKEFALMSKGLGKSYLTCSVVNYHKADISRLYVTRPGGFKSAMPKYYRDRIYTEQEKINQVVLIQSAVSEQERKDYDAFYEAYGDNSPYSYETSVDLKKHARYSRFYKQIKDRKL